VWYFHNGVDNTDTEMTDEWMDLPIFWFTNPLTYLSPWVTTSTVKRAGTTRPAMNTNHVVRHTRCSMSIRWWIMDVLGITYQRKLALTGKTDSLLDAFLSTQG
jgi:hypothetical protein